MLSQIMLMGFLAVSALLTIASFPRVPDRRATLRKAAARRRRT